MTITPAGPDNNAIREQLEEMKKLNRASASYNKLIVAIASATLLVSIIGVAIAIIK